MIKNYQFFKETINKLIAESGLDIGAVYFIMKDTFNEIEKVYYSRLNSELLAEQKECEELEKQKQESAKEDNK